MAIFGRPPKYKPEFCQKLIDHMSEGLSYESFAATLDCASKSVYNWEKKYPDFLRAKEIGFAKRKELWEREYQNQAFGEKKGNPAMMIFAAKNIMDWKDKQEVEQSTEVSYSISYEDADEKSLETEGDEDAN